MFAGVISSGGFGAHGTRYEVPAMNYRTMGQEKQRAHPHPWDAHTHAPAYARRPKRANKAPSRPNIRHYSYYLHAGND